MTTEDPRCDRSDLPASMCSHCRGHDDPPKRARQEVSWGEPETWRGFRARYEGHCYQCYRVIAIGTTMTPRQRTGPDFRGESVTRTVYVCEECVADAD